MERIELLEKRIADLEEKVQSQPNLSDYKRALFEIKENMITSLDELKEAIKNDIIQELNL